MLLMLLIGISNVTCVSLTLTPNEATTVSWAIMTCPLIDADNTCYFTRQIMTCELIDIVYFSLGTGNIEF